MVAAAAMGNSTLSGLPEFPLVSGGRRSEFSVGRSAGVRRSDGRIRNARTLVRVPIPLRSSPLCASSLFGTQTRRFRTANDAIATRFRFPSRIFQLEPLVLAGVDIVFRPTRFRRTRLDPVVYGLPVLVSADGSEVAARGRREPRMVSGYAGLRIRSGCALYRERAVGSARGRTGSGHRSHTGRFETSRGGSHTETAACYGGGRVGRRSCGYGRIRTEPACGGGVFLRNSPPQPARLGRRRCGLAG